MTAEKLAKRYGRRLAFALAVDRAGLAAAVALTAAGLWVLATRRLAPELLDLTSPVLLLVAGGALAVAALQVRRRRYSADDVAAFADWHSRSGGLLLTLRESADPRWELLLQAKDRDAEFPLPRWETFARRVVPGALFLGIAFLVPIRVPDWKLRMNEAGRTALDRIDARMGAMAKERLLSEEEEKKLRAEVGKIREDLLRGTFGSREWEATDAMRKRLDQAADRTLEAMKRGAQALGGAERESLGDPKEWSLDEKTDLQKELEQALLDMAQNNLFGDWPEGFDPKDLQEWLDAMRDNPAFNPAIDPAKFRKRLADIRKFAKGKLARLRDALPGEEGALAELEDALEEAELALLVPAPGRGGIDRGRGDAPMLYGNEPKEQQEKFDEQALRGRADKQATPGDLLGLEKSDPAAAPDELAERGREEAFVDPAQEATWKRTIGPKHRGVVKRYFSTSQGGM